MTLMEAYRIFEARPRQKETEGELLSHAHLMTAAVLMSGLMSSCRDENDLNRAIERAIQLKGELIEEGGLFCFYDRYRPCLHEVFKEASGW